MTDLNIKYGVQVYYDGHIFDIQDAFSDRADAERLKRKLNEDLGVNARTYTREE